MFFMWKEINIGPHTISVKQIIFWNKQNYSETNLNYQEKTSIANYKDEDSERLPTAIRGI